jgi:hypothetical protein
MRCDKRPVRIYPQFVGQPTPDNLEMAQCHGGLPIGGQGEHQPGVQTFVQRFGDRQVSQIWQYAILPTDLHCDVGVADNGRDALLANFGEFGQILHTIEVGEWFATEQSQRLLEPVRRDRQIICSAGFVGLPDQQTEFQ